MADEAGFQKHWLDIEPERMERYEKMFRWNTATEIFYASARIGEGQIVVDFGCGPGHAAVEFARRVGPGGHVHALDINAAFIERARAVAEEAGFGDRITAHLLIDAGLPLPDASVDRIIARNTIIYVADPVETLGEFRRVLKPGGLAHAIEGDWRLTAVEPVPTKDWRALIEAAAWAWPRPEIGRGLYGYFRKAGFVDVSVQVLTSPDTTGRLTGMIETVADHARRGGAMDEERIAAILKIVKEARAAGIYLAISPQFIVTATV